MHFYYQDAFTGCRQYCGTGEPGRQHALALARFIGSGSIIRRRRKIPKRPTRRRIRKPQTA